MVFYEIQETTERFMYDTTVVGLAPLLLFAPVLKEVHRGRRVVFELSPKSHVAVDVKVAGVLQSLRGLVATFVDRSVGTTPTPVMLDTALELSRLFAEQAGDHKRGNFECRGFELKEKDGGARRKIKLRAFRMVPPSWGAAGGDCRGR